MNTAEWIMILESDLSGHGITQDIHQHGHEVIIAQRSVTCLDSGEYLQRYYQYSENGGLEK